MDILDKQLGDSLQEAVDGFYPKDVNQALQESLKHASLLWNANLQTAMGTDGGGQYAAAGAGTGSYGITSPHPLTPLTPHPGGGKMHHQQQPTDETSTEISEVVEGAMIKGSYRSFTPFFNILFMIFFCSCKLEVDY